MKLHQDGEIVLVVYIKNWELNPQLLYMEKHRERLCYFSISKRKNVMDLAQDTFISSVAWTERLVFLLLGCYKLS